MLFHIFQFMLIMVLLFKLSDPLVEWKPSPSQVIKLLKEVNSESIESKAAVCQDFAWVRRACIQASSSLLPFCVLVNYSTNMALQKDDVLRHQAESLGDVRSSDMNRGDVSGILKKHKINNGSGILDSRNCVDERYVLGTKHVQEEATCFMSKLMCWQIKAATLPRKG
jgi:hypothetical protein